MEIDNQDFAILTRVNELAERYGLKPYDFVAAVRFNEATEQTELHYEVIVGRTEKIKAMVAATGARDGLLSGDTKEIIDALDQAIAKAPASRFR